MQKNPKALPSRILGVDFGLSRFGLALSDERKIVAMPLMAWTTEKKSDENIKKFIKTLTEIAEKHQCTIEEILIGLPLMMSGRSGLLADEVVHFIGLLRQSTDIPIRTWDERLSTVQAEKSLRESSMTRKKRTQYVDTVSATLILQSYLDSRIKT